MEGRTEIRRVLERILTGEAGFDVPDDPYAVARILGFLQLVGDEAQDAAGVGRGEIDVVEDVIVVPWTKRIYSVELRMK